MLSSPAVLPPQPLAAADTKALRSSGHLEVLKIKRRSRKTEGPLVFKGSPGSKSSSIKSVQITFTGEGNGATALSLDKENGRMHLGYPTMEHPEVQALLADPRKHICYFWTSFDGAHSHAWVLRMR